MRHPMPALLIIVTLVVPCSTAGAATCDVPSAIHPTIQSAIDDGTCTEIILAAGTFPEAPVIARNLSLQGAGSGQSFIHGQMQISAGVVQLTGLQISAASDALWTHSGGRVAGFDLVVIIGGLEPVIFVDGFEDGTTDAWSAVLP